MWRYLLDQHPMAITREVSTEKAMKGAVAVYQAGVYRNGESRVSSAQSPGPWATTSACTAPT